jgi:hypothetical protein
LLINGEKKILIGQNIIQKLLHILINFGTSTKNKKPKKENNETITISSEVTVKEETVNDSGNIKEKQKEKNIMVYDNILEIIRLENNLEYGMFGVLKLNHSVFCVTLERPWLDNKPYISCIPSGEYDLELFKSPKFFPRYNRLIYRLKDVENRSNILIHSANLMSELEGCIAVGKKYGFLHEKKGILSSLNIFYNLLDKLDKGKKAKIIIKDFYLL